VVLFDTTFLIALLDPSAATTTDHAQEKVEYLIETLEESNDRVLIPTPVLSEALVYAGDELNNILASVTLNPNFVIADFDVLGAVEVAMMVGENVAGKLGDETKAKVKFDRQILGIAKANGAHTVYSDDGGMRAKALSLGLAVQTLIELPRRPPESQGALDLGVTSGD
jgi:predicted nucleic acid-binding protein